MSTKSNKRKKKGNKGGGRRAAPASSVPKQTKAQLKATQGSKNRNWYGPGGLKERYMAYEFLTYTAMSKATGIAEDVIQRQAGVKKNQPETWREERTRKTQELAEARHEKDKAAAGDFNARMREQILLSADTLEVVGRNSLILKDGTAVIVSPADAVRAVAESARLKQGLVGPAPKPATAVIKGLGERDDGDEDEPQGVVLVPIKQAEAAWLAQQKDREAATAAKAKKDGKKE